MNPRILLSRQLWASAAYLMSYIIVGTALFEVALTIVVTAGALSIPVAGLPLLVIAAILVRGCADVERGRLLLVMPAGVPSPYLPVRGSGVFAEVKARWTDPATRRDLAYLVGDDPAG